MHQAYATTRVSNRLREPHNRLVFAFASILGLIFVFCSAGLMPRRREGNDDKQCQDRPGNESQHLGISERVDIVEGKRVGIKTQIPSEMVHDLWIVFEDCEELLRHGGG